MNRRRRGNVVDSVLVDAAAPISLASEEGIRLAYATYGAELYRAARRLTGDDQRAEDVVQETFVRAWRAADRFDERLGSLRTWLFRIMRNLVIDEARAAAVRPAAAQGARGDADAQVAVDPATVEAIDRRITSWQIDEALGRLTENHRHVIVEVVLRDRPTDEVAGELGIPAGTVKSRVYYALRALHGALDELGWTDR